MYIKYMGVYLCASVCVRVFVPISAQGGLAQSCSAQSRSSSPAFSCMCVGTSAGMSASVSVGAGVGVDVSVFVRVHVGARAYAREGVCLVWQRRVHTK